MTAETNHAKLTAVAHGLGGQTASSGCQVATARRDHDRRRTTPATFVTFQCQPAPTVALTCGQSSWGDHSARLPTIGS